MKSKLIKLTDGSKLEVKVNFYTLYLWYKKGKQPSKYADGIICTLQQLFKFDFIITQYYLKKSGSSLRNIILRSNGLKVDEEEAMMLTPMDADSIREIFEEFEKRLNEYKKKEQAKKSVAPRAKKSARQ